MASTTGLYPSLSLPNTEDLLDFGVSNGDVSIEPVPWDGARTRPLPAPQKHQSVPSFSNIPGAPTLSNRVRFRQPHHAPSHTHLCNIHKLNPKSFVNRHLTVHGVVQHNLLYSKDSPFFDELACVLIVRSSW